jgi:small-conductance mechanosensitive channel
VPDVNEWLIQIGSTVAVVLLLVLVIRLVLRRGRIARLLDDDSRRMLSRSLTLLVVLGGVLVVLATNNPEIGDQLTQGVISFLPRAVAGSLMLIAAIILGRLLGVLVSQILRDSAPVLAARVGKVITVLVTIIGSVLAADQFGVTTDLILLIIGSALATVALATALAFGLGAQPIARQVAAGRHVDDRYNVGDFIEVGGITGTIESIGLASTRIVDDAQSWEIPNERFLDEPVRVVPGDST